MTSRIIAVDPFDLVVFGGAGDLAYRKLLPALYHRHRDGQLPTEARIIGVSRRGMSDEEYRAATKRALDDHVAAADREPAVVDTFLRRLHFVPVDAQADAGWADLAKLLKPGADRIRAFYLAVAPELFGTICGKLGAHGLATPKTRVIIEKPIGHDLQSARAVNDAVGAVFDESQIYRIDHYLGKETVQNLMALRFGNALFEPLWNAAHIDHVQITWRKHRRGSRGGYYDTSGALRDMVQNHLMQLLCLVAMEAPSHMDADSVRREDQSAAGAPADRGNGRGSRHRARAIRAPGPAALPPTREVNNAGARRRPSSRSRRRSPTGAGPACRSISAPASGSPSGSPRSSSPSGRSRTRSSTTASAPSTATSSSSASSPTRASASG